MGDRGNLVLHDGTEPPLYIYSHWNRTGLPGLLANALATPQAESRIGDGQYLARIVFCQIMKQVNGLDEETGWGLSTYLGDGDETLHLDLNSGEVTDSEGTTMSRKEFIEQYRTLP